MAMAMLASPIQPSRRTIGHGRASSSAIDTHCPLDLPPHPHWQLCLSVEDGSSGIAMPACARWTRATGCRRLRRAVPAGPPVGRVEPARRAMRSSSEGQT